MKSRNILIVDDEQIIRNVLKRKVEQSSTHKVFTADDGRPALEIFKQEQVDLVISDLMMLEMSGIELLRNLKQIDPRVPVIIITGYGTLDDAIEAIHLGAEDFIKKPFDINQVLETIEKTFRKIAEQADQREAIKYITDEQIVIDVPNDFDYINTVINYIFSHLRARWLVTDEQLHDVKICLYEALSNALEHGNLGISGDEKSSMLEVSQQAWKDFLGLRMRDPQYVDRRIRVHLQINEEFVQVAICDEGEGFDHRQRATLANPEEMFLSSGRGLLLIQSLMDEVSFNEKGNEVSLRKNRSNTGEPRSEPVLAPADTA